VIYHATVIVGHALVRFGGAVATVFKRSWDFLQVTWSRVLRPLITWSWSQIQRLHNWLVKTLGPVLQFLERVRREFQRFYDHWFRPIFDTIDAARRVLRILATFHVAFARELERKLADLEDRLLRPITELYRRLNEAMNWIDRIVTFDGYFQRLTLIASTLRYERDMWKVWWTSAHKRERERPQRPPSQEPPPLTPAVVAAAAAAYIVDNEGPDKGRIDEHVADLAIRLRAAPRLGPA
jgi:hypothetical protein